MDGYGCCMCTCVCILKPCLGRSKPHTINCLLLLLMTVILIAATIY